MTSRAGAQGAPDTAAVQHEARDTLAGADVRTAARSVRLCAGGDVTLGTNLDTGWVRRMSGRALDSAWLHGGQADSMEMLLIAPLHALTADASIVLINAEGAIGGDSLTESKCLPGHIHCFSIRSPVAAAHALRHIGDSATLVVANLANNHARDAGDDGFRTTVALLEAAGVLVTGADTEPTLAVTPTADTVAILGFSAWSIPGVEDLAAVDRLVRRAVATYRRVVVTAHLGAEGRGAQRTRDTLEQYVGERRGNPIAFAHAAVDAGAGLVVAHGPHVLRAAEWRDGALILYSLGNLVNYGPFGLAEPEARGAVFCATLDSLGRPAEAVLRPTRQPSPGIVRPDASRRALILVDSLSRLDFPATGARVDHVTGAITHRTPRRPARQSSSRRRRSTD